MALNPIIPQLRTWAGKQDRRSHEPEGPEVDTARVTQLIRVLRALEDPRLAWTLDEETEVLDYLARVTYRSERVEGPYMGAGNTPVLPAGLDLSQYVRFVNNIAPDPLTGNVTLNLAPSSFTVEGITEFRDRFPASKTGTSEEFWETLLVKELFPAYTSPTASLASSTTGLVKRGTLLSLLLTPGFSQGDAGGLTAYSLTRTLPSSNLLTQDTTPPISFPPYTDPYTFGEGPVSYTALFSYSQGPEKQTSQGNPAPGQIPAGSVQAQVQLQGIHPWYYGASPTDTTPTIYQGTEVIGLSNGSLTVPSFGNGSQYLWFAVPRTSGNTSQKAFTTWFRSVLDTGAIGGSSNLFRSPVTVSVTSTGLAQNWTRNYDLYFTNYPTVASTATTLS
ncbi:hypothetical protein Q5H92_14825 [Hymenobacter sp. M29]|uniref:Uncharacterized protein n=1 Tax=Hymenobacter mellowenesis TaxID=3063995 RepID=A0ABT9AER6_9BACT|nr:hypothetical protein [Hymenobacter sp. M29]MDO7847640.1 hypothetical protein [Hymenobacter sp. M29]